MKTAITLFLLLTLISCGKKKYEYVEIARPRPYGIDYDKEPVIIEAESDSMAYLEAYDKFYISEKVDNETFESTGVNLDKPVGFKLFRPDGSEVPQDLVFLKRDSLLEATRKTIDGIHARSKKESDANLALERNAEKAKLKTDNKKIDALKKYFSEKKDEFDTEGKVWIMPKSAPSYINRNAAYIYFQMNDGLPSNPRFKFSYCDDDWLFITKLSFLIDGKAYDFLPDEVERDNEDGMIWEWFDQQINYSNHELFDALKTAKKVKIKVHGNKYFDIRTLTPNQLINIKRSLEYFEALGGSISSI